MIPRIWIKLQCFVTSRCQSSMHHQTLKGNYVVIHRITRLESLDDLQGWDLQLHLEIPRISAVGYWLV